MKSYLVMANCLRVLRWKNLRLPHHLLRKTVRRRWQALPMTRRQSMPLRPFLKRR
jgi:hypothetical protein